MGSWGKIAVGVGATGPRADVPADRAGVIGAAASHPAPGEAGSVRGVESPLGGGRTV